MARTLDENHGNIIHDKVVIVVVGGGDGGGDDDSEWLTTTLLPAEMQQRNFVKSRLVYELIDTSDGFYRWVGQIVATMSRPAVL